MCNVLVSLTDDQTDYIIGLLDQVQYTSHNSQLTSDKLVNLRTSSAAYYSFAISTHPIAQKIDPANAQVLRN
jgi:hypothetical protein